MNETFAMSSKYIFLLLGVAGLLFSSISVRAKDIVIDDQIFEWHNIGANATYTAVGTNHLAGFDASGSDKLVLVAAIKPNQGSTPRTFSSVTYGTNAMTEVIYQACADNYWSLGIFYLDNPPSPTDLVIVASGRMYDGVTIGLIALSGTELGVGPSSSSATNTTVLTTQKARSMVIAGCGDQGVALSPLNSLFDGNNLGAAYQLVSDISTITPTFTDGGSRRGTVVAAFEPPPPAGTVLVIK
jgi:hypothetical protein